MMEVMWPQSVDQSCPEDGSPCVFFLFSFLSQFFCFRMDWMRFVFITSESKTSVAREVLLIRQRFQRVLFFSRPRLD
jgi:hypothetical protein